MFVSPTSVGVGVCVCGRGGLWGVLVCVCVDRPSHKKRFGPSWLIFFELAL